MSSLLKDPKPNDPVTPFLPPQDGYLFLDKSKFPASFAADVSADAAAFMADSPVPFGVEAACGTIKEPAWRTKPSSYLVATEDKMIADCSGAMNYEAGDLVFQIVVNDSGNEMEGLAIPGKTRPNRVVFWTFKKQVKVRHEN